MPEVPYKLLLEDTVTTDLVLLEDGGSVSVEEGRFVGVGALDGASDLQSVPLVEAFGSASMQGASDAAADGFPIEFGVMEWFGQSELTMSGTGVGVGLGDLTGLAAFSPFGVSISAGAELRGNSDFQGRGLAVAVSSASVAGASDVSEAVGTGVAEGAVSMDGGTTIDTGEPLVEAFGTAAVNGASDVQPFAYEVKFGVASANGASDVEGALVNLYLASSDLRGEGNVVGEALPWAADTFSSTLPPYFVGARGTPSSGSNSWGAPIDSAWE